MVGLVYLCMYGIGVDHSFDFRVWYIYNLKIGWTVTKPLQNTRLIAASEMKVEYENSKKKNQTEIKHFFEIKHIFE